MQTSRILKNRKFETLIVCASFLFISSCTQIKEDKNQKIGKTAVRKVELYNYAPSTVSSEARTIIESFTDALSKPAMPAPDSIKQWKMMQQGVENASRDQNKAFINQLGLSFSKNIC